MNAVNYITYSSMNILYLTSVPVGASTLDSERSRPQVGSSKRSAGLRAVRVAGKY